MLLTSLRAFIVYAILLGIIYPLAITTIGHFTMPNKANGSLIVVDNKVVGSSLIGQNFTYAKYFHGRFSANDYDATLSATGGNNFAPSDKKFFAITEARVKKIRTENKLSADTAIPADMALSSASGLDPHISQHNAILQTQRVAKARNIAEEKVLKLIVQNTDKDFIGIWGQEGVNVLKLNLALDALVANGENKNHARTN